MRFLLKNKVILNIPIILKKKKKMRMLSVFIPESYIESLDILVADELFPNRSEAIRSAIRDLIRNELILKNAIAKRKEENENKKKTNQKKIK